MSTHHLKSLIEENIMQFENYMFQSCVNYCITDIGLSDDKCNVIHNHLAVMFNSKQEASLTYLILMIIRHSQICSKSSPTTT